MTVFYMTHLKIIINSIFRMTPVSPPPPREKKNKPLEWNRKTII
jgi:hypothetical protein